MRRFHNLALLPAVILLILVAWHIIAYYHYKGGFPPSDNVIILAMGIIMGFTALLFRGWQRPVAIYLERLMDPLRPHMMGLACIIIGGMQFLVLLNDIQIYYQMGFMVLLLGLVEASGLAMGFNSHFSRGSIPVTRETLKRLLANLAGKLGMVFALSAVMLYLSLMAVVGFTGPFSAAFLAALMILAIAFISIVRRL